MHTARPSAFESADTVNRVVALLVRFPELHSVRSNPADATLTVSFAVRERLDRIKQRALADRVSEHVRAFLDLRGDVPAKIALACDRDTAVTFVNVTRDAASFAREELELLVALFADAYGDRLVRDGASATPLDDDDAAARDEHVEVALDALRDPTQRRRLVGFREEQRVLVYFVHARKRTKARARS
jgi:predicted ATPase